MKKGVINSGKPKNVEPTVALRYVIQDDIYEFNEPVEDGDIIEFEDSLAVVEEVVGHSLKLSTHNVKSGIHVANIYDA